MLIANAKNMQNDVIISLSVLLGLIFTFVFELPILDTLTAFAVSGWIMYVAFKIFMKSNNLFDIITPGFGDRPLGSKGSDVGVIERRGDFNHIQPDNRQGGKILEKSQQLAGGKTTRFGRPGPGRKGRIEKINIDRQVYCFAVAKTAYYPGSGSRQPFFVDLRRLNQVSRLIIKKITFLGFEGTNPYKPDLLKGQ